MKRQKLKVFNGCCHSANNNLFTIQLNRFVMFTVFLLLSTLLPLNQAAPATKAPETFDRIQSQLTSPGPQQASDVAKVERNIDASGGIGIGSGDGSIDSDAVRQPSTLKRIESNKITDKEVDSLSSKSLSNPLDIMNEPAATHSPPTLSSAAAVINDNEHRKQQPTFENNHGVEQTKSDFSTATIVASSSNNYQDKHNNSVTAINDSASSKETAASTTPHDVLEQKTYAGIEHTLAKSPSTTELKDNEQLSMAHSATATTTSATATFAPLRQDSINALSDTMQSNINGQQATASNVVSSEQQINVSSVPISASLSDNATPSAAVAPEQRTSSSLTEIDELSLQQTNQTISKLQPLGEPISPASTESNPLSIDGTSTANNGNDKLIFSDNIRPNENEKQIQSGNVDGEIGQNGVSTTRTATKQVESNIASSTPQIKDSSTVSSVGNEADPMKNNNASGENDGNKVFDEEKSKRQQSIDNNNNNKNENNKDKSKNGSNEEGGVNDPNGKSNDNNSNLPSEMLTSTTLSDTLPVETTAKAMAELNNANIITPIHDDTSVGATITKANPPILQSIENNVQEIVVTKEGEIADPTAINTSPQTNAFYFVSTPVPSIPIVPKSSAIDEVRANGNENKLNAGKFVVSSTEQPLLVKSETDSKFVEGDNNGVYTASGKLTTTLPIFDTSAKTMEKIITLLRERQPSSKDSEAQSVQPSNGVGDGSKTADNEFIRTTNEMNSGKEIIKPTFTAATEKQNILDYDKSSEEIFDIVHESSTFRPEIESVQPIQFTDELFVPADDLDIDLAIKMTSATTTPSTTTFFETTGGDSLVTVTTIHAAIETTLEGERKKTTTEKGSTVGHDSDTIFYISNTEVKVVESSVPTPNSKQENQFFPALYEEDVIIDLPGKNLSGWNTGALSGDKYEEDIILSPMKNNFDPTKLNDENLSISYVGESFIDIKEATSDDSTSSDANVSNNDISGESSSKENSPNQFGDDNDHENAISSNVIIQPAILPDLQQQQSIGVPVIEALPPQIDIRDLGYKRDAIQLNDSGNSVTSQLLTHSGDNLQKAAELTAELPKSDSEEAVTGDEIDKSDKVTLNKRNETQHINATAEAITNVTAASSVGDNKERERTRDQIGNLIVVTSLILSGIVFIAMFMFIIRVVLQRLADIRKAKANGVDVERKDSSDEELVSNVGDTVGISRSDDNLITPTEQGDEVDGGANGKINHHSNANGSLITMTMKNNHLIVETEERSDIARDVRETKVHYSPSEKDGVFVVEVARGADSNTPILKNHTAPAIGGADEHTGNNAQNTIVEMPEESAKCVDYASSTDDGHASCSKSNEEVLVHPPPNGMCTDDDVLMIDEDGAVSMSSPKHNGNDIAGNAASAAAASTGLSQSDLSISSNGSNRGYSYGQQDAYTVETKGYQSSSPHSSAKQERIITPDPITVICDEEHANGNEDDEPKSNANDFTTDSLPNDVLNDNVVMQLDNGVIDAKSPLKTIVAVIADEINENGNEHIVNESFQQNGIAFDLNGKHNGDHINGLNGNNNEHLIEDSGDFDSLMNLPPPPPLISTHTSELKPYTDITVLDNGNLESLNLDSLPPPPPEQMFAQSVTAGGPGNDES